MGRETIGDKNKEIEALQDELKAKDAEIASKDAAIASKDVVISESQDALKLSDAAGIKLAGEIENMGVPVIENGRVGSMLIMTAEKYAEYSKENGRVMGREANKKTVCTIEELRALINSSWTPSMIIEKHGISAEELKQLVWKLSKKELRDKPVSFSIQRDTFGKEG